MAEDFRNIISNLGNETGVVLEVKIDNQSLMKLGVLMAVVVLGGVGVNHLLKSI